MSSTYFGGWGMILRQGLALYPKLTWNYVT